jgi:hypothetical protein
MAVEYYVKSRIEEFPYGSYLNNLYPDRAVSVSQFSHSMKFREDTIEILEGYGFRKIWVRNYIKSNQEVGFECVYMYEDENTGDTILVNIHKFGTDDWDDDEEVFIPVNDISFSLHENKMSEVKDNEITSITFYHTNVLTFERIQKISSKIAIIKDKKKAGHIYLIVQQRNSLDVEPFEIKKPDLDIELNYGKKFAESWEIIQKSFNDPKNDERGRLLLLHGLPGTGKSTFINYLANNINRKILWLPTMLAESITSPGFITLLMENKGCVLIIEDAERVIGDRSKASSSSVGVSNILNLTDGVLGEALNIHVIATFNTEKENIDEALLRSGRLIAEHKFDKLNVEDSNKLLEKLGKSHRTDKPMPLCDIYTADLDQIRSEKGEKKIGFGR